MIIPLPFSRPISEDDERERDFHAWKRYEDELNELEEIAWNTVPKYIDADEKLWYEKVNGGVEDVNVQVTQIQTIPTSLDGNVLNDMNDFVNNVLLNNSHSSTTKNSSSNDPCAKEQMDRFWTMIEYMTGLNQMLLCILVGVILGWMIARCRHKRQFRNVAVRDERNAAAVGVEQNNNNSPRDFNDRIGGINSPGSSIGSNRSTGINFSPRQIGQNDNVVNAPHAVPSQRRRRSRRRRQPPPLIPTQAVRPFQGMRLPTVALGGRSIRNSVLSSVAATRGIVPTHGQINPQNQGSRNTGGVIKNFIRSSIPNGFPGFIDPRRLRPRP